MNAYIPYLLLPAAIVLALIAGEFSKSQISPASLPMVETVPLPKKIFEVETKTKKVTEPINYIAFNATHSVYSTPGSDIQLAKQEMNIIKPLCNPPPERIKKKATGERKKVTRKNKLMGKEIVKQEKKVIEEPLKAQERFKLQAIVVDNKKRAAMIDQKIFRSGDFIEELKIIRIEPQMVWLKSKTGVESLIFSDSIADPKNDKLADIEDKLIDRM
jgi:hypothetical protein